MNGFIQQSDAGRRRYGVVAGRDSRLVADLVAYLQTGKTGHPPVVVVETPVADSDDPLARKLALYEAFRRFESDRVDALILPAFADHGFLEELQAEVRLPVFSLFAALRLYLDGEGLAKRPLGILTDKVARDRPLFERWLNSEESQLLYPDAGVPGPEPISHEWLENACRQLQAQGGRLMVPTSPEIMRQAGAVSVPGVTVLDVNRIYADYILSQKPLPMRKAFKIGIVGGVGPAATVDLFNKIVISTDARCDQDHLKVVVEQNPQIPDRTEHLLRSGIDPTLALYATCKRLQDDGASLIAIPCNTAHVFVPRIQPYLTIPIVNMLQATMRHIRESGSGQKVVGLLATTGTIQTRVYHEAAEAQGIELRIPDAAHQLRVMEAIYGPRGVKAGYTEGECAEHLQSAMASLVEQGAEILILGCTELPLLMQENPAYPMAGKTVAIVDPTAILARTCVRLARQSEAE